MSMTPILESFKTVKDTDHTVHLRVIEGALFAWALQSGWQHHRENLREERMKLEMNAQTHLAQVQVPSNTGDSTSSCRLQRVASMLRVIFSFIR